MNELLHALDALQEKKSKISKSEVKTASDSLYELLKASNDIDLIANYIKLFHYTVCYEFVAKGSDLKYVYAKRIVEKLVDFDDKISQYDLDNTIVKCFIILNTYISSESAGEILSPILRLLVSLKKDKKDFSYKTIKYFKEYVVDKSGLKFTKINIEAVDSVEKEVLYSLIKQAADANMISINSPEIKEWINKYYAKESKEEDSHVQSDNVIALKNEENAGAENKIKHFSDSLIKDNFSDNALVSTLLDSIRNAYDEANAVINEINIKNSIIRKSENLIKQKEEQINKLNTTIQSNSDQIHRLEQELKECYISINNLKEQNENLSARLGAINQVDEVNRDQQLLTLKKEIYKSIEPEYRDYIENKDNPYDEENYEAFITSLGRIFRKLQRLGITFEDKD